MAGTRGSVLVLQFGPVPKSYVATSYPHRIMDADPKDRRRMEYQGMPKSLTDFLKEFERDAKRDEKRGGKPRYIMNLATFAPLGSAEWNGATAEDPPGNLWFVYFWISRGAHHRWNAALPPSRLYLLASEFESGSLSQVAFGPTKASEPGCIFLRNTGADERWQYQWTGLPFHCERDVLRHIEGSTDLKGLKNDTAHLNGLTEWIDGRLRGVTFGPDHSFVVYRGEHFDWEGSFPAEFGNALRTGKDSHWSINTCVLNPRNPNEYILAFNEADGLLRVYYAVHRSFVLKLEAVIQEWANGKDLPYETKPVELSDAQCQHNLPHASTEPYSSRQRTNLSLNGQRISISSYPTAIAVIPTRPKHQVGASPDLARINESVTLQQPQQSYYQGGNQTPYLNGNQAPPQNQVTHSMNPTAELYGNIPPNPYQPQASQDIPPAPPYHQPIQHITHNHFENFKPRGRFKLTFMSSADDDQNPKGKKKRMTCR